MQRASSGSTSKAESSVRCDADQLLVQSAETMAAVRIDAAMITRCFIGRMNRSYDSLCCGKAFFSGGAAVHNSQLPLAAGWHAKLYCRSGPSC